MATIVNNPGNSSASDSNNSTVIAIVVVLLLLLALFYFGSPFLRGDNSTAPTQTPVQDIQAPAENTMQEPPPPPTDAGADVIIPDRIDVNVNNEGEQQ